MLVEPSIDTCFFSSGLDRYVNVRTAPIHRNDMTRDRGGWIIEEDQARIPVALTTEANDWALISTLGRGLRCLLDCKKARHSWRFLQLDHRIAGWRDHVSIKL
jgi:hypothetical protein